MPWEQPRKWQKDQNKQTNKTKTNKKTVQDKASERKLNEIETSHLLDKDFKVRVIKILNSGEEWMNTVRC